MIILVGGTALLGGCAATKPESASSWTLDGRYQSSQAASSLPFSTIWFSAKNGDYLRNDLVCTTCIISGKYASDAATGEVALTDADGTTTRFVIAPTAPPPSVKPASASLTPMEAPVAPVAEAAPEEDELLADAPSLFANVLQSFHLLPPLDGDFMKDKSNGKPPSSQDRGYIAAHTETDNVSECPGSYAYARIDGLGRHLTRGFDGLYAARDCESGRSWDPLTKKSECFSCARPRTPGVCTNAYYTRKQDIPFSGSRDSVTPDGQFEIIRFASIEQCELFQVDDPWAAKKCPCKCEKAAGVARERPSGC